MTEMTGERARVNKLIDERARVVAQKVAVEANLYAAEYLLGQASKLLPAMIADSAVSGLYRDALVDDINALLAGLRHPGAAVTASEGEAGAVTATRRAGDQS